MKFATEFDGQKILKTGQHMAKLLASTWWHHFNSLRLNTFFLRHCVSNNDQQLSLANPQ